METKNVMTRHSDVYSECLDILIYYIKVHSLAIHVTGMSFFLSEFVEGSDSFSER